MAQVEVSPSGESVPRIVRPASSVRTRQCMRGREARKLDIAQLATVARNHG